MHNQKTCAVEQVFVSGSDKHVSTQTSPSGPLTAHSGDWHRADIIAAVHKSGTTISALSVKAGLKAPSLSNVFYRRWPRAEKVIAEHLKVDPAIIWPSRYGC